MTTSSTDKDTDMKSKFQNGFQEMVAQLVKKYPDLKFLNTTAGEYGTMIYISCYLFLCIIFTFIIAKKMFSKKKQPRYYPYY